MDKQISLKPKKKGVFESIFEKASGGSQDFLNKKIKQELDERNKDKTPEQLEQEKKKKEKEQKNEIWFDIMKSVGKKMKNLDLKNRKKDSLYDNIIEDLREKKRIEEEEQENEKDDELNDYDEQEDEEEEQEIELPEEEKLLLERLKMAMEKKKSNKVTPKYSTSSPNRDSYVETMPENSNMELISESVDTLYNTIPKMLPLKEKMVSLLDDMKIISKRMNQQNKLQMFEKIKKLLIILEQEIIDSIKQNISELYRNSQTLKIVYNDTMGKDNSLLFKNINYFSKQMETIYENVKLEIMESFENIDSAFLMMKQNPQTFKIKPTFDYFGEMFSNISKLIDELRQSVLKIKSMVK